MPRQVVSAETVKQATVAASSAGLVSALFLGGLYVLWALFVVSGLAQTLMDIVSSLHFISPVYVIEEINPLHAASLALLTAAIGYAAGGAVAFLWNRMHPLAGLEARSVSGAQSSSTARTLTGSDA